MVASLGFVLIFLFSAESSFSHISGTQKQGHTKGIRELQKVCRQFVIKHPCCVFHGHQLILLYLLQ